MIVGTPPLSADQQVLAVVEVPQLDPAGGVVQPLDVVEVTLPLGAVVTEVRVAFSPA